MDQKAIQERVEAFFRRESDRPLSVATQDCCSEMSRLVGSWVKDDEPMAEILIFKGIGEGQPERNHEVMGVRRGNQWLLVDPTIWQIFPSESTITIGFANSVSQSSLVLAQKYGGFWKVNHALGTTSREDVYELEDTLKEIIRENVAPRCL